MPEELNWEIIRDIIICDPVTSKGVKALNRLKLPKEFDINYFYNEMCVPSTYHKDGAYCQTPDDEEGYLLFPYSVDEELFNEKKEHLELFDKKLVGVVPHESPLIMYGTRGSGKSIEVNRKIRFPEENGNNATNYILYDFDESCESFTYGETFYVPDANDVLWLFFMSLYIGFYGLIEKHKEEVSSIKENHELFFANNLSSNGDEIELFSCIGELNSGGETNHRCKAVKLFRAINKQIDKNDAVASIKRILKMTMNFMYCVNPKCKNYIVFDNIEEFIKLNYCQIPIPEDKIIELYQSIKSLVGDSAKIYDKIKQDELWLTFKIILVCRRATKQFLTTHLQFAENFRDISCDYTGCIDIWRIWEQKKKHIWEAYLKSRFDPEQYTPVLWILEDIMNDTTEKRKGTAYQKLILPLMNMGIRRNAHTQAHTVMDVWKIIRKNQTGLYIDYPTLQTLLDNHQTNRYMYRRALLEIHYKWMIMSKESSERFRRLMIGSVYPKPKKPYKKDTKGSYIGERKVDESKSSPFVQRVLSYLSNHYDPTTKTFQPRSLYELMRDLFVHPDNATNNPADNSWEKFKEHFLTLAKALNALGNMDYNETKSGPMVILEIHNELYNKSTEPDRALEAILRKIWEAGEAESHDDGKFSRAKYNVRLTEAGNVFVSDVKPSFSFFAALYCSEEVPLFFLKDAKRIKIVIETVYNAAEGVCNAYELAASSFCGAQATLRQNGLKYLLMKGNNYLTFRQRVKDLHKNHLELYKTFVKNNAESLGLSNPDFLTDDDTDCISSHIAKYQNWEVDRECF
jgi:hypothetical protein